MTYGRCGNNLSEPPPIFNRLAKAGNRNSGPRIRRKWKSIVNTRAFTGTNLAISPAHSDGFDSNESALRASDFKRPNFWQELHISHKLCERKRGEYSQSAIQLPWNPYGTRRGSCTRATGLPWKADASIITRSLPSRTGS
jgi:hypothetical protein